MRILRDRLSAQQTGFTVLELMVGLAIGMLLVLVIMQVMAVFEAQNRTTTGTAEAQTNGGIALYTIARDVQMAGYPLTPTDDGSPLNCTTAGMLATLTPASIMDGASDALTFHYGDAANGGVPTAVEGISGNEVTLRTNFGCRAGDIVLITSGVSCATTSVSSLNGTTAVVLASAAGISLGANLACLGTWNTVTYAVNNGALERNGVPILAGIVNLQAQYGIADSAGSNQITRWVNAKDDADWDAAVDGISTGVNWGAGLTVAERNRIKAIRIAIVARNDKTEPANTSVACNSLTDAAPNGLCAWAGNATSPAPEIDLSADADWHRYRYRVFETIIPLRNVVWSKEKL